MNLFDNLVKYGMPFVPKPIVRKTAQPRSDSFRSASVLTL